MEKKPQIFLAHASEDKDAVMKVYQQLKKEGFKPWVDKRDLLPGQNWREVIPEALRASDFALVFLSELSVFKRGYVQREFKLALDVLDEMPEGRIFIIPVRIEDCEVPKKFSALHWANLYEEDGFEQIVRSVQTHLKLLSPKKESTEVRNPQLEQDSKRSLTFPSKSDYLALLGRGIAFWNAWREENPNVSPDLSQENLSGTDLSSANLSWVNLSGANLSSANLSGANLNGTNLSGANLSRANFENALLSNTLLSNTDLTNVTGLDQCHHLGPSPIDNRTLSKNPGLPKVFLQGCGLPDWLIEAYKLTQENISAHQVTDIGYEIIRLRSDPAILFHSCFISYSSIDDTFARKLYQDLQNAGVRCWIDQEDLMGAKIRSTIRDAIRFQDCFLLILSKDSVLSPWVEVEVEAALEKERERQAAGHPETILFPIRLDDAIMDMGEAWANSIRQTRHIGDFSQWEDDDAYRAAFDRLLRDLRAS